MDPLANMRKAATATNTTKKIRITQNDPLYNMKTTMLKYGLAELDTEPAEPVKTPEPPTLGWGDFRTLAEGVTPPEQPVTPRLKPTSLPKAKPISQVTSTPSWGELRRIESQMPEPEPVNIQDTRPWLQKIIDVILPGAQFRIAEQPSGTPTISEYKPTLGQRLRDIEPYVKGTLEQFGEGLKSGSIIGQFLENVLTPPAEQIVNPEVPSKIPIPEELRQQEYHSTLPAKIAEIGGNITGAILPMLTAGAVTGSIGAAVETAFPQVAELASKAPWLLRVMGQAGATGAVYWGEKKALLPKETPLSDLPKDIAFFAGGEAAGGLVGRGFEKFAPFVPATLQSAVRGAAVGTGGMVAAYPFTPEEERKDYIKQAGQQGLSLAVFDLLFSALTGGKQAFRTKTFEDLTEVQKEAANHLAENAREEVRNYGEAKQAYKDAVKKYGADSPQAKQARAVLDQAIANLKNAENAFYQDYLRRTETVEKPAETTTAATVEQQMQQPTPTAFEFKMDELVKAAQTHNTFKEFADAVLPADFAKRQELFDFIKDAGYNDLVDFWRKNNAARQEAAPAVSLNVGKRYTVNYKDKTFTGEVTAVGRVNARLKTDDGKVLTIPINAEWKEVGTETMPGIETEPVPVEETSLPGAEQDAGVTYRINPDLDQIEVKFASKPDNTVTKRLYEAGFKYNRKNKFWYAPHSDERLALAKELAGETAPIQPEEQITPTTPESEVVAKEPWQMRLDEFLDTVKAEHGWGWPDLDAKLRAKQVHYQEVEHALAEGKPVPPEVLKDYPDLAAKVGAKPPKATAGVEEENPWTKTGRTKPKTGDKVYTYTAGLGGGQAVVYGEVYQAKDGKLRVRMTEAESSFGRQNLENRYTDLTPDWTRVGEKHPTDLKFEEIKRREEEYEKEYQRKKEELAKKIEESKKAGNVHLDDIEKPEKGWSALIGHRIMDLTDNRKGTIKEVDEEGNVYIVYDNEPDRAPGLAPNKAALVLLGEKKPKSEPVKAEAQVDITFRSGGDAVGREYHGYIAAYDPKTGKKMGFIDYAYYDGETAIKMIEVEPEFRRRGVATQLLNKLREDVGGKITILGNYITPEGQAWAEKVGLLKPKGKTAKIKAEIATDEDGYRWVRNRDEVHQAILDAIKQKDITKLPKGVPVEYYFDIAENKYYAENEFYGSLPGSPYPGIAFRGASFPEFENFLSTGKTGSFWTGNPANAFTGGGRVVFAGKAYNTFDAVKSPEDNGIRTAEDVYAVWYHVPAGEPIDNTMYGFKLIYVNPEFDLSRLNTPLRLPTEEGIKGGERGETGTSAPVVGSEGVREEEGTGTETGVTAGTRAAASRFNLNEKFPEEVAQKLVEILNKLDDPIREFAATYNGKGIRFNYIDESELKRLPPHLQDQISMANAICVNHNWIGIPAGREINTTSIVHEVAHMAYYRQLDESVQQKALELVLADGNKIINFIEKTKPEELDSNGPISQSELANRKKWYSSAMRRYKKKGYGPKEIEQTLEIDLLVPDSVLGEIAKLAGCMAYDDQYAVIAYHLALCKKVTGETFSGMYNEEAFAYLAGARPEILARALENKELLPEEAEKETPIRKIPDFNAPDEEWEKFLKEVEDAIKELPPERKDYIEEAMNPDSNDLGSDMAFANFLTDIGFEVPLNADIQEIKMKLSQISRLVYERENVVNDINLDKNHPYVQGLAKLVGAVNEKGEIVWRGTNKKHALANEFLLQLKNRIRFSEDIGELINNILNNLIAEKELYKPEEKELKEFMKKIAEYTADFFGVDKEKIKIDPEIERLTEPLLAIEKALKEKNIQYERDNNGNLIIGKGVEWDKDKWGREVAAKGTVGVYLPNKESVANKYFVLESNYHDKDKLKEIGARWGEQIVGIGNKNWYLPIEKLPDLLDTFKNILIDAKAVDIYENKQAQGEKAEIKEITPSNKIATFVKELLEKGEKFNWYDLFRVANEAFGGTQAEGKYTPKDAYDAMELGINQYLLEHKKSVGPLVSTEVAKQNLESIEDEILDKIPTQTKRTEEQEQYQQFSTPPNLAYVAAWAANIHPGETVLEPSAGIGGLAVFAKTAGAKVVVNELSKRRAEILKEMGFDRLFTENAEQLDNILPEDIKPTVVLMNPPFSATAGRMGDKKSTRFAKAHIEQALKRLEPGGRLVAIVGRGMADNSPTFADWWKTIKEKYNVRANISIDGSNYRKYGTSFDVQFVVIDKTGPTTGKTLTGDVLLLDEIFDLLEGIKNDRRLPEGAGTQQTLGQPNREEETVGSEGQTGPRRTLSTSTDELGTGERETGSGERSRGRTGVQSDESGGVSDVSPRPRGRDEGTGVRGAGPERSDALDTTEGVVGTESPERGSLRTDTSTGTETDEGTLPGIRKTESEITIEQKQEEEIAEEELTESIYATYKPQKLNVPGAKPHPGDLVESAAMAAVEPPDPTYVPNLPKDLIESGKLSDAQLEAIVYAGQNFEKFLPTGERKGFFIGDGTGVGKGREIAGIILDSFRNGQTKAVWVSKNMPLAGAARRDLGDLGINPNLVFEHVKIKSKDPIKNKSGILFTAYTTLAHDMQVTGRNNDELTPKKGKRSRIDQVVEWLGEDFEGVIVFDESHYLRNCMSIKKGRRVEKPAAMALAGIELARRLPKARILYVSATGGVEVSDLGYLERLGLWGEGTPFANKQDFVSKISSGGLAAMELVARDMKAMGNYIARNLSYDGVTYETLVHELDEIQTKVYDTMAESWQIVLQNIDEALNITGAKNYGQAKAAALSAFWGAQQRFFNQVLTAMQMPTVIKSIQQELKNGNSVVLQIVNTNEATQDRAINKKREAGEDLEDLDLTPREILIEYLKKSFPVQQYETTVDEDGNEVMRPVYDSQGNPVLNREAVAKRDALIRKIGAMKVPDSPLDMLMNVFGYENVAEITGRSRRVVKVKTEDGGVKTIVQNRTVNHRVADAKAFMEGKKRILIFSDAGGTGESYHADRSTKNHQKRIHYLIQAGWSATKAVQGFGRTHRSNQAYPPHYVLVTTNLKGQRRFISTIARRLDQLGALTKGQRQAGSQGLFSASDNLESEIARDALDAFYRALLTGEVEGINGREIIKKIGLEDTLIDKHTGNLKDTPARRDTARFLNRILVLESDVQNKIFDAYFNRLQYMTQKAIEEGTLDRGLENYRKDKVEVINELTVYRDPITGAETKYIELNAGDKVKPFPFEEAQKLGTLLGFYRQKRSGKIYAIRSTNMTTTTSGGHVVKVFRRYGQAQGSMDLINEEEFNELRYEKLGIKEAEKLWNEEIAKLPEYKMQKVHLITGTILPIWDRLPTGMVRVIRVRTDDGRIFLGRMVNPYAIKDVLKKLGAETTKEKLSPADIKEQILNEGRRFKLANGWELARKRVSGEYRIEIIGSDLWAYEDQLQKAGVFSEEIGYETRYFIPTGEKGAEVIEKITRYRPIVLDDEATMSEVEKELGTEVNEAIEEITPKMGFSIKITRKTPEQVKRKAKWRFEDEEIQQRWDAAKIQKEALLPKIREAIRVLWNKGTREFEHLPHTPEFAELRYSRHGLLSLLKQRGVCGDRTLRIEQGITIDLDPYTFDVFTVKVILDDLMEEAELGHDLPFGFTPESLAREKERIDAEVEKHPEVQKALKKRNRIWKAIKNDYIKAMQAIDFNVEKRFTKENYYRHQVLLFAQAKNLLKSTGREVRTPTGRGFLKHRKGSKYDINTDYIVAEYEVMAQMLYDIEVAKLIALVKKEYNIRDRLEQEAKTRNNAAIEDIIVKELEKDMQSPTQETLKEFKKKLGRAFSELRDLAENGQLWDGDKHEYAKVVNSLAGIEEEPEEGSQLFRYLAELAKDEAKEGNIQARTIFKAIADRNEFIKDLLGDKFVTWRDLIPAGYVTWQPREGNILYLANSIPERIAEKLQMGHLETIGISKEDIKRILVVGQPHKEYVVKQEVALTLDNLRPPLIDNIVVEVARKLTRPWKIFVLTAPQKLIKYNLRNISGDAEAVFVGNPSAFKKVPQAVHELYQVLVGNRAMTPEMKAWFERGGMQSTLQAAEAGDIKNLEIFEKLYEKEQKQGKLLTAPEKIWRRYWQLARLSTDFREAILRYAAFLDYLEQMKNDPDGRPKNFGASNPREIMALDDIEDRAYVLSNQLLGAYDQVSVIGQNVREFLIPFWSWNEVNFKRYIRFIRNAANDRKLAAMVGRKMLGTLAKSPFIAYRIGKLILKILGVSVILYLWNTLFFHDEEEDLPKDVQAKPHIILGRDKDGKVKYIDRLGMFADFLEWFGLDDVRADIQDVLNGRMSFKDGIKEAVLSPVNKIVQGITPLIKLPFETAAKTTIYPDISKPGHIYDRMEYLAQQFGLADEYKMLKGLPHRPYSENFKSWFTLQSDPGEAAYYDVKELKQQYMKKLGKGNEIAYFENPKSEALYNLKMAIRYKDMKAFEKYLQEYILLGGTPRGMKQSLDSLHPLYGLKGWNGNKLKQGETNEAMDFWRSLTPEEQNKVKEAVKFYENVLLRKGDKEIGKHYEKAVKEALKKMD